MAIPIEDKKSDAAVGNTGWEFLDTMDHGIRTAPATPTRAWDFHRGRRSPSFQVGSVDESRRIHHPAWYTHQPSKRRQWSKVIVVIVVILSLAVAVVAAIGLHAKQAELDRESGVNQRDVENGDASFDTIVVLPVAEGTLTAEIDRRTIEASEVMAITSRVPDPTDAVSVLFNEDCGCTDTTTEKTIVFVTPTLTLTTATADPISGSEYSSQAVMPTNITDSGLTETVALTATLNSASESSAQETSLANSTTSIAPSTTPPFVNSTFTVTPFLTETTVTIGITTTVSGPIAITTLSVFNRSTETITQTYNDTVLTSYGTEVETVYVTPSISTLESESLISTTTVPSSKASTSVSSTNSPEFNTSAVVPVSTDSVSQNLTFTSPASQSTPTILTSGYTGSFTTTLTEIGSLTTTTINGTVAVSSLEQNVTTTITTFVPVSTTVISLTAESPETESSTGTSASPMSASPAEPSMSTYVLTSTETWALSSTGVCLPPVTVTVTVVASALSPSYTATSTTTVMATSDTTIFVHHTITTSVVNATTTVEESNETSVMSATIEGVSSSDTITEPSHTMHTATVLKTVTITQRVSESASEANSTTAFAESVAGSTHGIATVVESTTVTTITEQSTMTAVVSSEVHNVSSADATWFPGSAATDGRPTGTASPTSVGMNVTNGTNGTYAHPHAPFTSALSAIPTNGGGVLEALEGGVIKHTPILTALVVLVLFL